LGLSEKVARPFFITEIKVTHLDILGSKLDNKRQDNYVDFIVILKWLNQKCFSGNRICTTDRMEEIISDFFYQEEH
jgi:hypothetical protein